MIGPGGRVIKNIIAQTGATVDVEDDGKVTISGTSEESVSKALEWVKGITKEVTVGETFEGEVKRILPFGAFIEFLPGKEGMVHVSQMSTGFVRNPMDVVSIGKKVKVKVIEIDEQGRINLSMLIGENGETIQKEKAPINNPVSAPTTPSEHPLARQFRRERFGGTRNRSQGNWRERQSNPRFRKPHY